MLGCIGEPAGHLDRLCKSDVSMKHIPAWFRDLPPSCEVRLLELFELHDDFGVVERVRIARLEQRGQFVHSQTTYMDCTDGWQRDESVWLHGDGAVEFRAELEIDVHDIARYHPVARIAVLKIFFGR